MGFNSLFRSILLWSVMITLMVFGTNFQVHAQGELWTDIQESNITSRGERGIVPAVYRSLRLNQTILRRILEDVPMRDIPESNRQIFLVELPMPGGENEQFAILEAPVMEPELAAKFPEIKSYIGRGIETPDAILRMSISPVGFHGQIISSKGTVYIDPYFRQDNEFYISYYKRDFITTQSFEETLPLDESSERDRRQINLDENTTNEPVFSMANDGSFRVYRIAIATTGEYTNFHRGRNATMAELVNVMTRVNGVYSREVAIEMQLVGNNDLLIYTNATTDPYTPASGSSTLLAQNQINIDRVIGANNYDLGHVFSARPGGGSARLGSVCRANIKAMGETGLNSPIGDPFYIDFVAHELGHQWGANHTFNGNTGSCAGTSRNPTTSYEPGSGSTIMAYADICSGQNVQSSSDDYFHYKSLEEIIQYSVNGLGSTCGAPMSVRNTPPAIQSYSNGYTIPKGTPFKLEAYATDTEGDLLTYCWEQYDLGVAGVPSPNLTTGPLFRSFPPSILSYRMFPERWNILNGFSSRWEVLPNVSRNLTFKLTVRDNSWAGNLDAATSNITVNGDSGPFQVTNPNTNVSWKVGSAVDITWDVNNTNMPPVNCQFVDILLSKDGGINFSIPLAEGVPNNGETTILVPNELTQEARIMVKASNNIFFDISDQDFVIEPGEGIDVAFIIDNTGSMAEEIGSVRDALLRILATFSPESGTVFQLTTFKDDVTNRESTIDLEVITQQVGALRAARGGDCPEASVQAIESVMEDIKPGGMVFLATDADPHPGQDLEAVKNALVARDISVYTIVSATCNGGSFRATSSGNITPIPISYNDDRLGEVNAIDEASSLSRSWDAIATFSYLADETNGVFVFLPEAGVEYPSSNDLLRFENTSFNIIQGGIRRSVAFSQPSYAPRGANVTVTLRGINTHFNSNTRVTFDDSRIIPISTQVISDTELSLTLLILSNASLGLKDITITTGGEVARGVDIFEITSPPIGPQITGVSPPSGKQGDSLDISITGVNTNFSRASRIDLGEGISVNSFVALSGTQIQAQIFIEHAARTGYRDLKVTTGTEVARENMTGPFLVTLKDAINCSIDEVIIGTQSPCNPATNTYSQTLYISYSGAPISGTLDVNGQSYPILGSPQTVTLENLPADGRIVPLNISFSEEDTCGYFLNAAFTAPASCLIANCAQNLALNRPVYASTEENDDHGYLPASYAVDGNPNTRWSSRWYDPQWIYVDLGYSYDICRVKLKWEQAYARNYEIQVSDDASNWRTIRWVNNNHSTNNDWNNLSGTGRYLRILGTRRATNWGYSIYELEVYGRSGSTNQPPIVQNSSFYVDENSNTHTYVGRVQATDPDGDALTYQIIGGNLDNAFYINYYSGQIGVNNSVALDYERTQRYNLTVRVTDDGINNLSEIAYITVHINNLPDEVLNCSTNLALSKPIYASSEENDDHGYLPASYAVDGNINTRWSSLWSDPQWIYVDLGARYDLCKVILRWEDAYARDYQIQVSDNANNWTTVRQVSNNNNKYNVWEGINGNGRYVRIYGTRRATRWGYSLYEFEVYADGIAGRAARESLTEPLPSLTDELLVYPNPAEDLIHIRYNSSASGKKTFTITDVLGRTIQKEQTEVFKGENKWDITLDKFAKGSYIIHLFDGNEVIRKRFIKQ